MVDVIESFISIYVMWSPQRKQYKIGKGDVLARLNSLRTGNPDLELVFAVTDAHAHITEPALHAYFSKERDAGEWFDPSPNLEWWIDRAIQHPGVAVTLNEVAASWATRDVWPWGVEDQPEQGINESGQTELMIDIGPYQQPAGKAAPNGNGYAQVSSISEDWYTHPVITNLVRKLYDGVIDLDPMSCLEANRNYVRAEKIYTARQDGLRYPWVGKVFLNPPWGGSDASAAKVRAVKKAILEYRDGDLDECVLVLNSNATTTAWFEPLFEFPMCFPPRRIPHLGPGGKGGAPNSGTVIIYIGTQIRRFADIFSELGNVVHRIKSAGEEARASAEDYEDV